MKSGSFKTQDESCTIVKLEKITDPGKGGRRSLFSLSLSFLIGSSVGWVTLTYPPIEMLMSSGNIFTDTSRKMWLDIWAPTQWPIQVNT